MDEKCSTKLVHLETSLNDEMNIVDSNIHATISALESEMQDNNITNESSPVRNNIALNKSPIKYVENEISKNESRSKVRFQIFIRFCTIYATISQWYSKIFRKLILNCILFVKISQH